MRYSRMEEPQRPEPKKSSVGWVVFVVIIVVAAAVVYVIGASSVGEFLSDNVIDPISQAFSPAEPTHTQEVNPSVPPDETDKQAESCAFTLKEQTFYAIQAGAFTEYENAQIFAGELIRKGGAGYIYAREGDIRVLISAYGDEEDAKSVRDRLLSEQNMETSVFELHAPELNAQVKADPQLTDILAETDIFSETTGLMALSISLDKGEKDIEEVKQSIAELNETVKSRADELIKTEDALADMLISYYQGLSEELESLLSVTDEVEFSSKVKHAYLYCADARISCFSA